MNNLYLLTESPKEIERTIAGNVRAIRRRRKISQQKLADRSGVSLGSIKRFESTGDISLLSLCKIALALDIEKDLLKLFSDIPPRSIEEVIRGQN
ncbi:MAG: helix-turn-helix transcriptional regulator [Lachnospiraceae bacterium]|jgi:transcriptional regulator with XRE-family HTH domain|nr:helix-turn-helix transcriptional regulator [Lachnospiraceae bacterium]MEE3461462.1 helix-turn-helix transcriptional regulator [Lachnospiraceae bacterium]